jgi:hypothetical protein
VARIFLDRRWLANCATPTLMLDINQDLEGDVAGRFAPYTEARHKEFIRQALVPLDLGVQPKFLADLFKLLWGGRLHDYTRGFTCAR